MPVPRPGGSTAGVRRGSLVLGALATAALVSGAWMIWFHVPQEPGMGAGQRIVYVHQPSALMACLAFGVVALCSPGYLRLRDERLDAVSVCAAELGVVFTTLALATGSAWARVARGAWWVWDARLSFTLLLWFVFVGYFMLRGAAENPERGKRFAAILGVVAAADVPLIHVSVRWFHDQHPGPAGLPPQATAAPEVVQALLVNVLAFTLLFFSLLLARYGAEQLGRRARAARVAATPRPDARYPQETVVPCVASGSR